MLNDASKSPSLEIYIVAESYKYSQDGECVYDDKHGWHSV